jgi:hypothetical protein
MTLPDAWRRVRQRLFATRKFVVIRKKLEVFPVPDRLGEVVFRQASATDLERLDDLEAHGRGSTQRAHVRERHDMLFVACHGDRILATRRCGLEVRTRWRPGSCSSGPGRSGWPTSSVCRNTGATESAPI